MTITITDWFAKRSGRIFVDWFHSAWESQGNNCCDSAVPATFKSNNLARKEERRRRNREDKELAMATGFNRKIMIIITVVVVVVAVKQ